MLTIYGIKNCDTMKKAFAWLDSQGIAYQFIDYKKAGVIEQHLPRWQEQVGWEVLLNTRGLMWKKLSDDERANVDAAKAAQLMQQYPSIVKRPVVDTGAKVIVGFTPERYAEELK